MKLEDLRLEANEIMMSEFRFVPLSSVFHQYSVAQWADFCNLRHITAQTEGIYLPRTLSAHLNSDSEFLDVNFLHEFFGHGCFCEYSSIGKNIVALEKKVEEVEKEILGVDKLPEQAEAVVDRSSQIFEKYMKARQNLEAFFEVQHNNYEGFAMWLEGYLSNETGRVDSFQQKMDSMIAPHYKGLFVSFREYADAYGHHSLIFGLGFPRVYDNRILLEILTRHFGNGILDSMLVIAYGSREPGSDIDLFIVGEKTFNFYNGWLDIYAVSKKDFLRGLENLDIAMTDPLFTGNKLSGQYSLEELRRLCRNQRITQEAISYNLGRSEEQRRISQQEDLDERTRKIADTYHISYLTNARELKQGNKVLTLKNVKEKQD